MGQLSYYAFPKLHLTCIENFSSSLEVHTMAVKYFTKFAKYVLFLEEVKLLTCRNVWISQ